MKKTSVSEHIPSAQHLRPEAESAMPPEATFFFLFFALRRSESC